MLVKINSEYNFTGWLPTDALAITSYLNDADVSKNLLSAPYPYTVEHAVDWLNRITDFERQNKKPKNLAIRNTDDIVIGAMGLHFNNGVNSNSSEFGYWIGKAYWNKGIMTDAVRAFCDIAKHFYRIETLEADIFTNNPASMKVLTKNGFMAIGATHPCSKADGTKLMAQRFIKHL